MAFYGGQRIIFKTIPMIYVPLPDTLWCLASPNNVAPEHHKVQPLPEGVQRKWTGPCARLRQKERRASPLDVTG